MRNEWTEPFRQPKLNTDPDSTEKKKRAEDWQGTLKRIWSYLMAHRRMLFMVILMITLSSLLALAGPLIVGLSIDNFLVDGNMEMIVYVLLALGVVYILHAATVFLQHFWMVSISQKTVYTIRTGLFDHMQKLPIPFFDRRQHGELMSRLTNDIENISNTLNSSVIQIFQSVLTLAGILIVMLYLSPLLTLITLIIVPLMIAGMKWITKRTGPLFKAQQQNLGEMNGYVQETMSGQRIIKSFSQEERVMREFDEKNQNLRLSGFWAQTISGFIPKLMNMLNNVSFAVIAGVGGLLALQNMVTIGVIVIFAEYARQFTRPLNDLANQFNVLLSAIAGAERVFSIMDEKDELHEDEGTEELPISEGRIAFENVRFGYGEEVTINNVSFAADKGETVAFVGPTGAGKTTIISLLSRFYDPDQGAILIDGKDIRQVKKESLRRHMAFVLQDSFLFAGTIRENIRYGKLQAADKEVEQAAELANAYSFIAKMPDGFDTKIDAEGGGISQGQKQLLSIARALLADPAILVLDEATSSIDTITELKIQEALRRLMHGRTSIVIAHRLNTIREADHIIVLQEGSVTEAGSHEQLLETKGFYADLFYSQKLS
ncbi:ABC transporter ATP-binding protein [Alkalicoccus halolimnae]|uniref:ABC transporter ATP-binding protein n=1 Tax=Alkalicoccus halolimnae TaxID=1667239 RepID=A0A5C7F384_9BACI|nr:ABC transporter ATP-binding protein [Alkalicoccus halolimnae]TXF85072.1 ABC transporter ATP-binding protein [Alkalicoccus halolimnae]